MKTSQENNWSEQYEHDGYLLLKNVFRLNVITRLSEFVYGKLIEQKHFFKLETGIVLDEKNKMDKYIVGQEKQFGHLPRNLQHLIN